MCKISACKTKKNFCTKQTFPHKFAATEQQSEAAINTDQFTIQDDSIHLLNQFKWLIFDKISSSIQSGQTSMAFLVESNV